MKTAAPGSTPGATVFYHLCIFILLCAEKMFASFLAFIVSKWLITFCIVSGLQNILRCCFDRVIAVLIVFRKLCSRKGVFSCQVQSCSKQLASFKSSPSWGQIIFIGMIQLICTAILHSANSA